MAGLLFTGDFYPSSNIIDWISKSETDRIYSDFIDVLNACDISVTNLECPLYDSESPILKCGRNLKAPTSSIEAFNIGGFRLVTLANNHIMDHGSEGLRSTLDACEKAGIRVVGAGYSLEDARKPFLTTLQDKKVAIINITENEFSTTTNDLPGANGLNPICNYYDIKNAREKADLVFVVFHGGREHYKHPSPRIQELFHYFIDIGASAVIGHHTHCFQGFEIYKESPIFYSLGNFIFKPFSTKTLDTWFAGYAVRFEIGSNLEFEMIPYRQSVGGVGVRLLDEEGKRKFDDQVKNLNYVINSGAEMRAEFDAYCNTQLVKYKLDFEPYKSRYAKYLYRKGILPSLTTRYKSLTLHNNISCEAHREIVLQILKNQNDKT